MEIIITTAQVLAVLGGSAICYGALFLYEDEERVVQNVLDRWWIKIADAKTAATQKHVAFLNWAARAGTIAFDRVFGPAIVSGRALAVSGCISLASLVFSATTLDFYLTTATDLDRGQMNGGAASVAVGYIEGFALFLRFGIVVLGDTRTPFSILVGIAAALVVLVGAISTRFRHLPTYGFAALVGLFAIVHATAPTLTSGFVTPYIALVSILGGMLCDVLAISATRVLLRRQETWGSALLIVGGAVLQVGLAVTLIFGPPFIGHAMLRWYGRPSTDYFFTALSVGLATFTNLLAAACALVYVLCVVALLVHCVVWPVLERPLYQVARIGVFKSFGSRVALFGVGSGVVTLGLGRGEGVLKVFQTLLRSA